MILILATVLISGVAGCAKPAPTPPSTGLSGSFKVIGSNTATLLTTVWAGSS
ncbi:MAG: hypothetical protein ACE5LA_02155 [Dehalococcoidales bacterium]